MGIADILRTLGLDKKAVAIYTVLLEAGPLTISTIAERAGIHRPLIYKTLPTLREKGLVSLSPRGKQKRYVAESPERLQLLVQRLSSELDSLIPALKEKFEIKERRPLVTYLEGKRGITSVFEDLITTLKRGDVFYRYSSAKDSQKADAYLPPHYRTMRDKKQLERFVITSEGQASKKKPRLERSVKIVPVKYDLFDHNVTELIYANKVALIDYNSETAIIIKNATIADFQKRIFRLLFSKL